MPSNNYKVDPLCIVNIEQQQPSSEPKPQPQQDQPQSQDQPTPQQDQPQPQEQPTPQQDPTLQEQQQHQEDAKDIEDSEGTDVALDEKESLEEFEELPLRHDCWQRSCSRLKLRLSVCCSPKARSIAKGVLVAAVVAAYSAYLAYCIYLFVMKFRHDPVLSEQSIRLMWVSGAVAALVAIHVFRRHCPAAVSKAWQRLRGICAKRLRPLAPFWWIPEIAIIVGFLVWMGVERPANLSSAAGVVALLVLSLAVSAHPDRVNWKPVAGGMVIQLVFAALILRTSWGFDFFNFLGDRASEFVEHCAQGAKFVFGDNYQEHYFAFAILPIVVYFSAVLTVLFHFGILQAIICSVGSVMQVVMGTTAAESTVAASNIFVGHTEAPLVIRPFLVHMTNSEIHSVMTSGFATIAGGILAAYISMGVPARHLLSASVMSAPAALAVSKVAYPETQRSRTRAADVSRLSVTRYGSFIEAAGMGAVASLAVVGAIAVNLIAFVSLLAFINSTLTWLGYRAGLEFPLTFEYIMSFVFWPLALVMGVSPRDCRQVGELIGIKTFLNEFLAYQRFTAIKDNYRTYIAALGNSTVLPDYQWVGTDVLIPAFNLTLNGGVLFEDRSLVIATYALCGFSNLASIGILIGGLTAMAPTRQSDIAACAPRAMVAGSVACFLTACIAGIFFTDSDQVLQF